MAILHVSLTPENGKVPITTGFVANIKRHTHEVFRDMSFNKLGVPDYVQSPRCVKTNPEVVPTLSSEQTA